MNDIRANEAIEILSHYTDLGYGIIIEGDDVSKIVQALSLACKILTFGIFHNPVSVLTEEEKKICKMYLEDLDKTHTCNEYKILMSIIDSATSESGNTPADLIEYKPLDADFNTQSAVKNLRTAYWSNETAKFAKAFTEAEDIIISAICHGGYTVCKETVEGDLISREALKKQFEDRTLEDFNCYHFIEAINNAPTVEPICPYLSDNEVKQPCLNSPCERPQGECRTCRHRDPEDKKCDCGGLERQGCIFPVSDDYFCKFYEKGGAE